MDRNFPHFYWRTCSATEETEIPPGLGGSRERGGKMALSQLLNLLSTAEVKPRWPPHSPCTMSITDSVSEMSVISVLPLLFPIPST